MGGTEKVPYFKKFGGFKVRGTQGHYAGMFAITLIIFWSQIAKCVVVATLSIRARRAAGGHSLRKGTAVASDIGQHS